MHKKPLRADCSRDQIFFTYRYAADGDGKMSDYLKESLQMKMTNQFYIGIRGQTNLSYEI